MFGYSKTLLKVLDNDSGRKKRYKKVYTEFIARVKTGRDIMT